MLAIRIDKELEERLTAAAERSNHSITSFAIEAIEEHIEMLEDCALLEVALKDYDPSQNVTLEEVRRELGLDY